MIMLKLLASVFLLIAINHVTCKDSFSKIEPNLLNLIQCVPYAYGDFNADKLVDIYCISNSGKTIEIWLAQDKEPLFFKYKTLMLNDTNIVNLIPGDFNGDSIIDLIVLFNRNEQNYLTMRLYTGSKIGKYDNDISEGASKEFGFKFKDQPLAADLNADGIIDLFGEDQNGRYYYYFDTDGNVNTVKQDGVSNGLHIGYSNSIVDLNNDHLSDMVIISHDSNDKVLFEVWYKINNKYEYKLNYSLPDGINIFGQSIFIDYDSDGSFEHLLPACKDVFCHNSTIFVYKKDKWFELPIDAGEFNFQQDNMTAFGITNSVAISLKAGDYDLDGYIDLLVVMKDGRRKSDSTNQYAVILKNVPCKDTTKCNEMTTRTFNMDLNTNDLLSVNNIYLTSFFDLNEDGSLDILLAVKDANNYFLLGFKNELYDDVYFLKVMVLPGRCDGSTCPYNSLPYGINYATPFVRIKTESFEYKAYTLYASQLSQSSHLSLQLPFIIFGLGSTPNFVDRLIVGIEAVSASDTSDNILPYVKDDWTSIIPNSQLVINVNPRDNTHRWKMQLFLTPSKNILLTGISLGSTMICLIIVIILLQYREKKIDEKERKLESQRFHFDGL